MLINKVIFFVFYLLCIIYIQCASAGIEKKLSHQSMEIEYTGEVLDLSSAEELATILKTETFTKLVLRLHNKTFEADALERIVKALQKIHNLSHLKIGRDGRVELIAMAETSYKLASLYDGMEINYTGDVLDLSSANELAIILANETFDKIALYNKTFEVGALEILAEALQRNPKLTSLVVEGDGGVQVIAAALLGKFKLARLILGDGISDDGAQVIAKTLQKNVEVGAIVLSRNLGKGIHIIINALISNANVTTLQLDVLTVAVAEQVAVVLGQNTHLIELKIFGFGGMEQGALPILAKVLQTDTHLTTLSLIELGLLDEDMQAIAEVLQKNTRLITLDLSYNRVGDDGALKLAKSLESNKTLATIILTFNKITDDGAKKFLETLKINKNKTLTSLKLITVFPLWYDEDGDSNEIEEELIDEIARLTLRNKKGSRILIVGDGDFSYTAAFLNKHPEWVGVTTATEYRSQKELTKNYKTFDANIKRIETIATKADIKPEILFGVDATKLHEVQRFSSGFFSQIHFNFPMANEGAERYDRNKQLLKNFFQSSAQIQEFGDLVYIALPHDDDHWRDAAHYDIFNASSEAGYQEVRKHHFRNRSYPLYRSYPLLGKKQKDERERYPGYEHRQDIGVKASVAAGTVTAIRMAREIVFEKVRKTPQEILDDTPPGWHKYGRCLTSVIKTDDESSSYEGLPHKRRKLSPQVNEWYDGDRIRNLMRYYFPREAEKFGLVEPININAEYGGVILTNLRDRERLIREGAIDVPRLLVPVNLGEYNPQQEAAGIHWAGLYIIRHPEDGGHIQIWYFDPLARPMPETLERLLHELYPDAEYPRHNLLFQHDGCNCGPWIVEIFRALIDGRPLPGEDFDIEKARLEHTERVGQELAPQPSSSYPSSHKVFAPSSKKKNPTSPVVVTEIKTANTTGVVQMEVSNASLVTVAPAASIRFGNTDSLAKGVSALNIQSQL